MKIIPITERALKFYIYCNIRTKTLSVKALEGEFKGRVVANAEKIQVENAQLRVSEAGRKRVLRTRHKNVHAGVVGEVSAIWGAAVRSDIDSDTLVALGVGKPWLPFRGTDLYYNPYKTKTFVRRHDGKAVMTAARVRLDRCSIHAAGVN